MLARRGLSFNAAEVTEVLAAIERDRLWTRSPSAKILKDFTSRIQSEIVVPAKEMMTYVEQNGFGAATKDSSAMAMLSACLTFPLTLSYILRCISSDTSQVNPKATYQNVLVLGARSESSLPQQWWREYLLSLPDGPDIIAQQHQEYCIRMLGPHLLPNTSIMNAMVILDGKGRRLRVINNATEHFKTTTDRQVLHDHPDREKLLDWADLVLMYNPGFGSSTLSTSWKPTIELLYKVLCSIDSRSYARYYNFVCTML